MKRRAAPVTYDVEGVPKALLIGICIEVWSTTPGTREKSTGFPFAARRNYLNAREAWLNAQGVPDAEHFNFIRGRNLPYSVDYLIAQGRGDRASKDLARGDSTIDDLPSLRKQALELLAAVPLSVTESR